MHQTVALTGEASKHPLRVDLDDAWVDGDAVRIEQVVTNLLTNAIHYTGAGRPIHVRVGADSGSALLQVQDTGTGIPPALLQHVFDLFVQGDRPLGCLPGQARGPGSAAGPLERRLKSQARLHGMLSGTDNEAVLGGRANWTRTMGHALVVEDDADSARMMAALVGPRALPRLRPDR